MEQSQLPTAVFMTFKAMDMGLKSFSQDTALARLTGTTSLSTRKPETGEHLCSSQFIQAVIFFRVIQFYREGGGFPPGRLKIQLSNARAHGTGQIQEGSTPAAFTVTDFALFCGCSTQRGN